MLQCNQHHRQNQNQKHNSKTTTKTTKTNNKNKQQQTSITIPAGTNNQKQQTQNFKKLISSTNNKQTLQWHVQKGNNDKEEILTDALRRIKIYPDICFFVDMGSKIQQQSNHFHTSSFYCINQGSESVLVSKQTNKQQQFQISNKGHKQYCLFLLWIQQRCWK